MSYMKGAIHNIATIARAGDEDDPKLVLDMIEGETTAFERIALCIQVADHLTGIASGMDEVAKNYAERAQALKARAARFDGEARDIAADVIEETGQPLRLPMATLSRRVIPPKRTVSDLTALPDEFCRIERKADMAKIKAAEAIPPGVTVDNGGVSISIRRK